MDKEQLFGQVLKANQDRIYRICCCYVRDEDERRDVCQNVFLQIWKHLEQFAARSSISTWVYRITVNVCLGHLRLAQRRNHLFSDTTEIETLQAVPAASAYDQSPERQGDLRHLQECLQELPDLDKALVSLFLEDASVSEIAQVLGISEGNVRVKLHRVKSRLKQIWEKTDHEPR